MLNYLTAVQQSHTVAFADYVRLLEASGQCIVKMQTGDPDFVTHPRIVEAACDALRAGHTKYCDSRGLPELRNAIVDKVVRENHISATVDNVLVTHGAIHGVGLALRAILNPGDECIILEPYWRSYEMMARLSGAVIVPVAADPLNGFRLEADRVIEKITAKTRAIIVNSPNNPSGAVYLKDQLAKLARVAADRGVYLIADEVYEAIIYGNCAHYSMASDQDVADHVITAFSFSKTHAMTGWRIGYLVAAKHLVDEMLKLSQFSITSLSPFTQLGAVAALMDPDANRYVHTMVDAYRHRRERIRQLIRGTWLEACLTVPDGTFYSLIDCSRFSLPSLDLARRLVREYNVSLTPGIAFGDRMDHYLRLCFATSDDNIEMAINALIQVGHGNK